MTPETRAALTSELRTVEMFLRDSARNAADAGGFEAATLYALYAEPIKAAIDALAPVSTAGQVYYETNAADVLDGTGSNFRLDLTKMNFGTPADDEAKARREALSLNHTIKGRFVEGRSCGLCGQPLPSDPPAEKDQ